MSAAKITRHLADTVNDPLRFNQSRTRIKYEYIIIALMRLKLVVYLLNIMHILADSY